MQKAVHTTNLTFVKLVFFFIQGEIQHLPIIVTAVFKVNEHQLLFFRIFSAIKKQDISWGYGGGRGIK